MNEVERLRAANRRWQEHAAKLRNELLEVSLDQIGPYPVGSPEFHIWQAGHRAGWKSERRTWEQLTGCKYPQDVRARLGVR